jgi:hypothetical protein
MTCIVTSPWNVTGFYFRLVTCISTVNNDAVNASEQSLRIHFDFTVTMNTFLSVRARIYCYIRKYCKNVCSRVLVTLLNKADVFGTDDPYAFSIVHAIT